MLTEFQKMRCAMLFDFSDEEVVGSIRHAKILCNRMRLTNEFNPDYRPLLEELVPGIPKTATIIPPFTCDHELLRFFCPECSNVRKIQMNSIELEGSKNRTFGSK